jgi:hypothetical protein
MAYTNPPHLNGNIFQNQSKSHHRKKARAGGLGKLWQDKGHFANAPHQASQPAPLSNGSGARALHTRSTQAQKTKTGRTKLIHSTVHYEPRVHEELKRIAKKKGLSFSEVGNAAARFYIDAEIEAQHAETLRDILRQIIREELRVFGDRLLKSLSRIAFASEQGKLLTTNVLKFVLRLARLDQKTYVTLVNESGHQARSNVLANTPQFKAFFEERKAKAGKEGAGK